MSVLASNTAFIPLELRTCLQNLQHRMDTQRSLKVQLLVDIASHVEQGTEFGKGGNRSSFDSPRLTTKSGEGVAFEFSKALKSGRQLCFPDGKVKLVFIGYEEQVLVPFGLGGGEGKGMELEVGRDKESGKLTLNRLSLSVVSKSSLLFGSRPRIQRFPVPGGRAGGSL